MRGTIVGIVLFILACSSGALADGTPSTRTSEAPFSWAGLYVGANGRYGWGRAPSHLNFSSSLSDRFGGIFCGSANAGYDRPNSIFTASAAGSATADVDGWVGGGHVGYNWQSQRLVYGLETDFLQSGAEIRGRDGHPGRGSGLQAIVDAAEVGLAFRLNDYCLRIDLDAFAILLGLHALRACEAERPGCGPL